MIALRMTRDRCGSDATLGRLEVLNAAGAVADTLYTIEKPWLNCEVGGCGGEPFRSCVGPGTYTLTPHMRPNGDRVWLLTNPLLDVNALDTDVPTDKKAWGRYLVLIHAANYARDVVGCMGPGLGRTRSQGVPMVTRSRDAMKLLHRRLDGKRTLEIEIRV